MIQAMGQDCRAGGIRLVAAAGHGLHGDLGTKGWIGVVIGAAIGKKWMLGVVGKAMDRTETADGRWQVADGRWRSGGMAVCFFVFDGVTYRLIACSSCTDSD